MKQNSIQKVEAQTVLTPIGEATLPALIVNEGEEAAMRFVEFFTANIRNPNTRRAYARAVARFCQWCEGQAFNLQMINPVIVATYVEGLQHELSAPSVKQHLAGIRMLFDYLVTGHVVKMNPATSVRGPKHSSKTGKTPVLEGPQVVQLLDSISTEKMVGLRDRALISTMVYSFARIGALLKMNLEDYFPHGSGRTMMIRLHEKGGKHHEVPLHHNAETCLEEYIAAADLTGQKKVPLWRSVDRSGKLKEARLQYWNAWDMVKRRCRQAGLGEQFCNHTFRATGITVFLNNGGQLEKAQQIAAHESPRTTKLYDRTHDIITLDEINRIDLSKQVEGTGI